MNTAKQGHTTFVWIFPDFLSHAPGAGAEKINGSCPGKYIYLVYLNEYERRSREALQAGFRTCVSGKLEDVKPPQIQFKAF